MSEVYRAQQFPLYPNKGEEADLIRYLSISSKVYNAALHDRQVAWKNEKRSVGFNEQCHELTKLRAESNAYADVPVEVERSALRRVDLAFKHYFRRCQNGEKPGYPRYKSWRRYDSFSFGDKVTVRCNRVKIPSIGYVKFRLHRPIHGKIITATVKREAGKWFVTFQCLLGPTPPLSVDIATVPSSRIVGVDLGLKTLLMLSTGEAIANPRHGRNAAKQLANRQRNLVRKKKGSNSRLKAITLVQKTYAAITNRRKNTAWHVAKSLVSRFDVICYENLNIAGLCRGTLAKHIYDASWARIVHCLCCKAEEAGKITQAKDPWRTTIKCSGCGALVFKTLKDRIHSCTECGLVLDRDINAAINIKNNPPGRGGVTELVPETNKARSPKRKKKIGERESSDAVAVSVDVASSGTLHDALQSVE